MYRLNERIVSCFSLNPAKLDTSASSWEKPGVVHENVPVSALPLLATGAPEYTDAVLSAVARANAAYADFLQSDEGRGFCGQVLIHSR